MHNGVIFWLLIFAVSAVVFFVIAIVVIVRGFSDLRSLLRLEPGDKDLENGGNATNE